MNCLTQRSDHPIVQVSNQTIPYSQEGRGELILCLPPPLFDHRIYCGLQNMLSSSHKIVAIDLPKAENVDELLAIFKQVIRIGTKQPFHLLASSATGWIAQYLVQYFKHQLQSLILINSFHSTSGYGTKYRMALKSTKFLPAYKFKKEILEKTQFLRNGIEDKVYSDYLENRVNVLGKSGIREQLSWFLEHRPDPDPLEIPILSLFATNDVIISQIENNQLLSYHNNTTAIKVRTNSHLLFLSHPKLVSDKILNYIANKK